MVVPVDAHVHEREQVGEEHRHERAQRGEVGAVRRAQLEHHDRDDDRDDAVAEGLEAGLRQPALAPIGRVADHLRGRELGELALGVTEQAAQDLAVVLAEERRVAAQARVRLDEPPRRRGLLPGLRLRMRQLDPRAARGELRVVVDRAAVDDRRRRRPRRAAAPRPLRAAGSGGVHASIFRSSSSCRARRSASARDSSSAAPIARASARHSPSSRAEIATHWSCPAHGYTPCGAKRGWRLPRCTGAAPRSDAAANAGPIICAIVSRCARSIHAPLPRAAPRDEREHDRARGRDAADRIAVRDARLVRNPVVAVAGGRGHAGHLLDDRPEADQRLLGPGLAEARHADEHDVGLRLAQRRPSRCRACRARRRGSSRSPRRTSRRARGTARGRAAARGRA